MKLQATRLSLAVALVSLGGCLSNPDAFDEPTHAIVAPNGLVYVSDGYSHARVAVFDQDGVFQFDWGSKGFGRGQLNTPHALAALPDGSVLVADRDNARVQRFTADGAFVAEWFGPDLGRPWAVAVGPDARVYVVDGGDQDDDAPRSGLAELGADGAPRCRWGRYGDGPGELDGGHMLAVTDDGGLVVVDLENRRLVRFDAATPGGCDYASDPSWPAQDFGPDFEPLGIAARAGRIYVSEARPRRPVRVLDAATGAQLDAIGAGVFERPHGLFVDDRSLWVTDQARNRVIRMRLDGVVELELGADP